MKKNSKRIIAVLLAIMFIFSMMSTAFAQNGNEPWEGPLPAAAERVQNLLYMIADPNIPVSAGSIGDLTSMISAEAADCPFGYGHDIGVDFSGLTHRLGGDVNVCWVTGAVTIDNLHLIITGSVAVYLRTSPDTLVVPLGQLRI